MKKAVVVFSGGQDSTTCLVQAQARYDEVAWRLKDAALGNGKAENAWPTAASPSITASATGRRLTPPAIWRRRSGSPPTR